VGFWSDLHHVLSSSWCVGLDLSVSEQGQVAGFCDHDDEPSPENAGNFGPVGKPLSLSRQEMAE